MLFFRKNSEVPVSGTEVEVQQKSRWKSYVPHLPAFGSRKKSLVEERVLQMLDESGLCPSNPMLKALFIKNINLFFVLVETSGSKSIQLLGMTTPLFNVVASKANGRIKNVFERMRQDEHLAPYCDTIQDVEWDLMVPVASDIFTLLKRGSMFLYDVIWTKAPLSCIGISPSAMVEVFVDGTSFAFRVFHENMIPAVQLFYRENYYCVKMVLEVSPAVMNVISTVIQMVLKQSFKLIFNLLKSLRDFILMVKILIFELSNDPDVCFVLNSAFVTSKSLMVIAIKQLLLIIQSVSEKYSFVVRDNGLHIFDTIFSLVKQISPIIFKKLCETFRLFKKFITLIYPHISIFISTLKCKVQNLSEEDLATMLQCFNEAKRILTKMSKQMINSMYMLLNFLNPSVGQSFKFSVENVVSFIKKTSLLLVTLFSLGKQCVEYLIKAYKSNPIIKDTITFIFNAMLLIFKELCYFAGEFQPHIIPASRIVAQSVGNSVREVAPVLWMVQLEVCSTLFSASQEVTCKSCLAMKRIAPPILCALQTTAPVALMASNEIVTSFKNASVAVYPVLLTALAEISPVILHGAGIVLNDFKDATAEVLIAFYRSLRAVSLTVGTLSSTSPTVYRSLHEVLSTLLCAIEEVVTTSYKAYSKVLRDIQMAVSVMHSTIQAAIETFSEDTEDLRRVLLILLEVIFDVSSFLISVLSYIYISLDSGASELHFATSALMCCSSNYIVCTLIARIYSLTFHTLKTKESSHFLSEICLKLYLNLSMTSRSVHTPLDETSSQLINQEVFLVKYESMLSTFFSNLKSDMMWNFAVKSSGLLLLTPASILLCSASSMFLVWRVASVVQMNRTIAPYLNYSVVSRKQLVPLIGYTTYQCWELFCNSNATCWSVACFCFPKIWFLTKDSTSQFWQMLCNVAPQVWDLLEEVCPVLWQFINELAPKVWSQYKTAVINSWDLACLVSPRVWQVIIYLAPRLWSFNRRFTRKGWEILQSTFCKAWTFTCDESWNCWLWANTEGPDMWKTYCHANRVLWNRLCDSSTLFWLTSTEIAVLLWEFICQFVSVSWKGNLSLCSASYRAYTVLVCAASTSSAFCESLGYQNSNLASLYLNGTVDSFSLYFDSKLQESNQTFWSVSLDKYCHNFFSEAKTTSNIIVSLILMLKSSSSSVNCLNWPRKVTHFIRGSKRRIHPFAFQRALHCKIKRTCITFMSLGKTIVSSTGKNICDFSLTSIKMLPYMKIEELHV